jgi:hypothetical protein
MLSPKETLLLHAKKNKIAAAFLGCFILAACTPTVRVEAPPDYD